MTAETGTRVVPRPAMEHAVYAGVLRCGVRVGLIGLSVTFALYVGGILRPVIPISELPRYWSLSAREYLQIARLPQGWGWVALVGRGDFLNFLGVALLAGLTILGYVRILPILFRRRDVVYLFIAAAEIAVLVLAASGVLTAGP